MTEAVMAPEAPVTPELPVGVPQDAPMTPEAAFDQTQDKGTLIDDFFVQIRWKMFHLKL